MKDSEQINISAEVGFIWNSADILRDTYKPHQYQDVILPLVVLRRIECVIEERREEILKKLKIDSNKSLDKGSKNLVDSMMIASLKFNNSSKFTFKTLASEKDVNIKDGFKSYVRGFTDNIKKILENFGILKELDKLEKDKLLHPLIKQYAELDLSPKLISNLKMGYIYEELIRKFSEQIGEAAGQHFTPREIIQLMCKILFDNDKIKDNEWKTIYDPTCGTGGMLSIGKEYILENVNNKAKVVVFGQEKQPETWAIGASDMLLKGENSDNIHEGNTLTNDQTPGQTFDYMLANPPFGVDWKKDKKDIQNDNTRRFSEDRLPRVSDGSTLFLQHMISKMKPIKEGGSSIAIVFNGSPLFTGDAGSGESNFRKWILEEDLLDCIIALPKDLFYNTGIATYIWILKNKKSKERRGKVQLINSISFFEKMKKSLGKKTKYISDKQIDDINSIYQSFKESEHSKIFDYTDFGYTKVSLELTEVDSDGKPKEEVVVKKIKGENQEVTQIIKKSDSEYIPLKKDIKEYLEKEVELPYKVKSERIGYEINFTQYFYKYIPLRKSEVVEKEFKNLEKENKDILKSLGLI